MCACVFQFLEKHKMPLTFYQASYREMAFQMTLTILLLFVWFDEFTNTSNRILQISGGTSIGGP